MSANNSSQHRILFFVLRWGSWPPWAALLLRSMEHNPSIDFALVGDQKPQTHRWPANVQFHSMSLRRVMQRARNALGVPVSSKLLDIAGGSSKVSDFKPMLAHLFPELLRVGESSRACDFWGYMQEDQLLGNLRDGPRMLRSVGSRSLSSRRGNGQLERRYSTWAMCRAEARRPQSFAIRTNRRLLATRYPSPQ